MKRHSVVVAGHKTSISVEDEFWAGLREIAKERKNYLSELIADIDEGRQFANLSSAIRLFVLRHYRDQQKRDHFLSDAIAFEFDQVRHAAH
jgi:predicted DNA-binding ribbon-helix-helix protein